MLKLSYLFCLFLCFSFFLTKKIFFKANLLDFNDNILVTFEKRHLGGHSSLRKKSYWTTNRLTIENNNATKNNTECIKAQIPCFNTGKNVKPIHSPGWDHKSMEIFPSLMFP